MTNNVKDIMMPKHGAGKTGTLNNGTRVTARQGSSEGTPTLEIVVSKKI